MNEIILPELGEGIDSVEISEILIKIDDLIKVDETIIIVETEKASMEIPASLSGKVNKIHITVGDIIKPGSSLISIEADSKTNLDDEIKNDNIIQIKSTKSVDKQNNDQSEIQSSKLTNIIDDTHSKEVSNTTNLGKPVLASPSVRRFARELGCNLKNVLGTGTKNRITHEDVKKHIKGILENVSIEEPFSKHKISKYNLDFSKYGQVDIQPLSKIKKITGQRLQKSWQTIPHVTQFDNCKIESVEKLWLKWKKNNLDPDIKVSLIPFFIKSVANVLFEMPQFNSSLDEENESLIIKQYINIGVAVDTSEGLVVPVIKNANNKSIYDIAQNLTLLSQLARTKKLKPSDLEGGSFTISSLGGIGGTYFTPIVNPPEVAILGISKLYKQPTIINDSLVEETILPYSLSYDHRVIDGADAARFTTKFSEQLSKIKNIKTK